MNKYKQNVEILKYLSLISQLGIFMVVIIFGGFLLGLWVDKKFNLNGVGLLIFLILAIILGFVQIYKMVMSIVTNETIKKDKG